MCVWLFWAEPEASKEELMVKAVTEIVSELIKADNQKKDVDLNKWVQTPPRKTHFVWMWTCGTMIYSNTQVVVQVLVKLKAHLALDQHLLIEFDTKVD